MASAFNMGDLLGALKSTETSTIEMAATLSHLRMSMTRRQRKTGLSKQEKELHHEVEGVERTLRVLQGKFNRVERVIQRAARRGNHANLMQNEIEEVHELHEIQRQMGELHTKLHELQTSLQEIADAAAAAERESRDAQARLRRQQQEFDRKFSSDLNDVIGMMSGISTRRRSRSRSPGQNNYSRRSRSRSPSHGGATRRRRRH